MFNKIKFVAKLEKILTLLKNSKLEYLKASDKYDLSENKRFFNLQSTIRNRFFQEIISLLRSFNVEVENLVINRLNFEQIVISSLGKNKHNHLFKCVEFDKKLVKIYSEAIEIFPESNLLKNQREKISKVVEENTQFLESVGVTLKS